MVARLTGASLGFLAFTVTIVAGLAVGNPVSVTLSRSIFALFAFVILGMLLGGAAQLVIGEYGRKREAEILELDRLDERADPQGGESAGGAIETKESSAAA